MLELERIHMKETNAQIQARCDAMHTPDPKIAARALLNRARDGQPVESRDIAWALEVVGDKQETK